MTPPPATIEIPRIEGESARAYDARVRYITMGAGRSIERTAQDNAKTIPHYKVWSAKYNWVECARAYDDQIAFITIQEASAAYRRDLEAHRDEARKVGGEMITVGRALLGQVVRRLESMDYKPSDLQTAIKAILGGFDLRAHSLNLDRLLPNLGEGDERD